MMKFSILTLMLLSLKLWSAPVSDSEVQGEYLKSVLQLKCSKSKKNFVQQLNEMKPLSEQTMKVMSKNLIENAIADLSPHVVLTATLWPEHLSDKIMGWKIYQECADQLNGMLLDLEKNNKTNKTKYESWKTCTMVLHNSKPPAVVKTLLQCLK